jgi:hypothetical protein
MKVNRIKATALMAMAAIALSSGSAWADHGGHWRGGGWHGAHEHHRWHGGATIYLGPTFFWPGYRPPFDDPFFNYPPAPAVVEPPPVYIERGDGNPPPDASASNGLWYYCDAAGAYYPYVRQCPGGWQAVVPQQR